MLTDYEVTAKTHYIHGQWPPQWQPDTLTCPENQNPAQYNLGNQALPVAIYREHILNSILNNQFTIIRSATGSGKTTQVPQYLFEEGYSVIVTQPRIMAARTNSERIREELEDVLGPTGDLVGYRTKEEGDSTNQTKILLCTDGLQVMHELTNKPTGKKTVLVLDEIHERNHNMDVLLALAKRRAQIDPDFRVAIMSATVDVQRFADFLQTEPDRPVPIIDIPGQTFDIAEVEGGDAVDEAIKYGSMGLNVAIIVPGKDDIVKAISKITSLMPKGHTVLPLHRDQTSQEQQRVMASYPEGKIIVATNVLRSSITVPDLDVMIGCGWERTSETNLDVSGTYIRPVSLSSEDQERGRVGRTKFGIYVHGYLDGYPPLPPRENRAQYDTPEINRMRLDGTMLKLARVAIGMQELEFMDDLSDEALKGAQKRLQRIGALAIDGSITHTGNEMAFLPILPHHARMLVESRSHSYRIRQQMLAAIAVQQENGITDTDANHMNRWKKLSNEKQSDILQNLDIFIAALDMDIAELYRNGIVPKKFYRALAEFNSLSEREGLDGIPIEKPDDSQRATLIDCIVAGSDEIYQHIGKNFFVDPRSRRRKISNRSAMSRAHKELIMGAPFDLQKMSKRGGRMRRLVLGATAVNAEMLSRVSPNRCSYDALEFTIDDKGRAKVNNDLYFDGIDIQTEVLTDPKPSPELKEFLIRTLIEYKDKKLYYANAAKLQKTFIRLRDLQRRSTKPLDIDTAIELVTQNLHDYIPETVRSLGEVDAYIPEYTVNMFVPADQEAEILASAPNTITIKSTKLHVKYSHGSAYIDVPQKLTRSIPDAIPELGDRPVYVRKAKSKDYHLLQDVNVVSIVAPTHQRRKKHEDQKPNVPFFAHSPSARSLQTRKAVAIPQQRQPFHAGGFNRASTGRR